MTNRENIHPWRSIYRNMKAIMQSRTIRSFRSLSEDSVEMADYWKES